jgi:hypothetical protein
VSAGERDQVSVNSLGVRGPDRRCASGARMHLLISCVELLHEGCLDATQMCGVRRHAGHEIDYVSEDPRVDLDVCAGRVVQEGISEADSR